MLSIAMIFIPSAVFWSIGRPLAALGALFLQLSIIGWIPAMYWSKRSYAEYEAKKRYHHTLDRIKSKKKQKEYTYQ